MKDYKAFAQKNSETDIIKVGQYTMILTEGLTETDRKTLEDAGCDITDEEYMLSDTLFDLIPDLPEEYICHDITDYWEEDLFDFMSALIKPAPYYLIYAENCRWTGASGYKFTDSIADTVYRPYDVSIYPVTASKGGKTLLCTEYSHDVPTGHSTTIIALTEKEYDRLQNNSFAAIRAFALKQKGRT